MTHYLNTRRNSQVKHIIIMKDSQIDSLLFVWHQDVAASCEPLSVSFLAIVPLSISLSCVLGKLTKSISGFDVHIAAHHHGNVQSETPSRH